MQQYEPTLILVGRLLLAALFLWSGFHKVFNPEGTQQYMAAYGLTVGTMFLYLAATVVEFAGGIALAIGHTTREAVVLLILFMLMVTGIFHTHLADPNQLIQFVKNVAIIGGLIIGSAWLFAMTAAFSAWRQDRNLPGVRPAEGLEPEHADQISPHN